MEKLSDTGKHETWIDTFARDPLPAEVELICSKLEKDISEEAERTFIANTHA